MLVAVMMAFVIFSFTGVAVLNVSYLSSESSRDTIDNIKLQYAVESSINQALWRINSGVDSLANYYENGVSALWDSTSQTLTVNVDKFQMESEIILDLSEDTHFDRGIAAEENVTLNGNDPGLEDDQSVRGGFDFLPEADIAYFTENPDFVHTESWHMWDDETLADGKHLFTGHHIKLEDVTLNSGALVFTNSHVTIEDITVNSGTLVFTGYGVNFLYDNVITAPAADTTASNPAVIFTNEYQNFDIYSRDGGETIIGAVYCKGNIYLRNGHLSGPIIGRNVTLYDDFDFSDSDHRDRFRWTRGFGHRHNYDWPKHIGRWRIHKWIRKHFDLNA